jgi:hypothetical protein
MKKSASEVSGEKHHLTGSALGLRAENDFTYVRTDFVNGRTQMKTTKQFALVALLVLGAMLGASTPAQAQLGGIIPLNCQVGVDDPDYGASGRVSIAAMEPGWGSFYVDDQGNRWGSIDCKLIVECWDLTPGATYSLAGNFAGKNIKAARDGSLKYAKTHVTLEYYMPSGSNEIWWNVYVTVTRLNPDGTSTLVLD